jgi:hypothetical protein
MMKKLMTILFVLWFSVQVLGAAVAARPADAADNIHVWLILDCGKTDMPTWETLRARAIEAICALKAGDRVTVFTAYPSEPRRYLDITISSDKSDLDTQIKKIATLGKDWFVRSQPSVAMAFAYEYLDSGDAGRQCCIVLSSGDMGDEEFVRVKHVAELFPARKCPLVFICEHTLFNRQMLLCDMQIRFLDKPAIGEWLNQVRPVIPARLEPNVTPSPVVPGPVVIPKPVVVVPKPPAGAPVVAERTKRAVVPAVPKPGPVAHPDSNSVQSSRPAPKPTPKASDAVVVIPDSPTPPPAKTPDVKLVDPNKTGSEKHAVQANLNAKKVWYKWLPAFIAAALLLGLMVFIIRVGGSKKPDKNDTTQADGMSVPMVLTAHVGKDKHELGDPAAIREITIGSGLGSTILIDQEGIASRHCRITKGPKGYTVHNCSNSSISSGGIAVKPKGRATLDMPAEIEITDSVHVLLIEEEAKTSNGKVSV